MHAQPHFRTWCHYQIFLYLVCFQKHYLKRKDLQEILRLPWAHDTRLQQLRPLLLTTNVSNKSGICFSLKDENVGFVHSSCTVLSHSSSLPQSGHMQFCAQRSFLGTLAAESRDAASCSIERQIDTTQTNRRLRIDLSRHT
jgi:hypothetical protein